MSGPNIDTFQRAVKRFKQSISPEIARQCSLCTLSDVRDACRDIQQKHGQEGKLRNMRRLEAFIEAMEQFGKVIEVFVNASEFVCFIWGPIKFILNIARTHLDSFDKLLDVYAQVGEAIPGLMRYQATFEKHPPLATVLEDYYSDILEFHQAALLIFKRPKWKEMFHSTWKTFDTNFKPIMHSLKSRHELLESEKGSATLYEIHKLRQGVLDMQAEQKQLMTQEILEKHKARISSIREKLQAPNYQIDQEIATEDRQGYQSGTWIFDNPDFKGWFRDDTTNHGVLYVNGIPGAGKTTLMSAVVEKLLSQNRSGVNKHCAAYFYFKHKQAEKETYNGLLRAVLDQIIEGDPDLSNRLFPDMSPIEGTGLRSTRTLEKLVKTALESCRLSYIMIDGLDECASGEAAKSIDWLLSLADKGFENTTAIIRVLFCGQRDGVLDKKLAERPSIPLETSGHAEDINLYCQDFCAQIRQKFNIAPEMENDIVRRVSNGAKGMFLYARVVLENLLSQTKLSGLKQEIEPGTFPQGIEKAYERVAVRVFEKSSHAERDDATRILGWITCSRRLLRWREVQSLFCIDPNTGEVDYEGSRLRVTCKDLCGSLVDVHHASPQKAGPEDVIRIVHETAREYLIRRSWLNTCHDHARLAIFCSRYLTSKPFTLLDNKYITEHAIGGYYALQDYAVQHWYDHFREYLNQKTTSNPDLFEEAMKSAKAFLTTYGNSSKMKKYNSLGNHDEISDALNELPQDGNDRNAHFSIEVRTSTIRKAIEAIQEIALDHTAQEILVNLHGTTTAFKCSKPWCEDFTKGFGSAEDRKRHADRHDLPFYCPIEGCFAFQLGYDTQLKLQKHTKRHHPEPDDELKFPKVTNKKTSFWVAIAKGEVATVEAMLDSGTSIESRNSSIWPTALFAAVESGCFEICKLLVDRGAMINYYDRSAGTPLHVAIRAGDSDIARLLVSQKRIDPDKVDSSNRSPFCEACALGHLDIVKLLFETGSIQVNRRPFRHPECCKKETEIEPLTPFGYACSEGHVSVVQYLLQQGQYNLSHGDALERAVYWGHAAIIDLLLVEITASPYSLLQAAAASPSPLPPEIMAKLPDAIMSVVKESPESLLLIIERSPNSLLPAIRRSSNLLAPEIAAFPNLLLLMIEKLPDSLDLVVDNVPPQLLLPAIEISPALFRRIDPKRLPADIKAKDDWLVMYSQHERSRLDIELVQTLEIKELVLSLKFSHCGKYIALGFSKSTHVYHTTGNPESSIFEEECIPTGMAFGPDAYLAIGDAVGNIIIRDIENHTIRKTFYGLLQGVSALDYSRNEHMIVTGSAGTVQLWDFNAMFNSHTPKHTLYTSDNDVTSVAISWDAKWVVVSFDDGIIAIWDVLTGNIMRFLENVHGEVLYSTRFSPDSSVFVGWGLDMVVKMWGPFSGMGSVSDMRTFKKHCDAATMSVTTTPDTEYILAGSADSTVRFWDQQTGYWKLVLVGHTRSVYCLATSPTGNLFATVSEDKKVRIWSYQPIGSTGITEDST